MEKRIYFYNYMEKKLKIPTLIYSRVSGYYNPTVNFNKGKQEEFSERKNLNITEIKKCLKK
jgi:hypothetical protein